MALNGISTLRAGKLNAKGKRQEAKLLLAGAKKCGFTITEGTSLANSVDSGNYGTWAHNGGSTTGGSHPILRTEINGSFMDTFSGADGSRTEGTYIGVTGTTDGSGTGGTFNLVVNGSGAVTDVVVATPGIGHAVNDTITISDADLGGGGAADFTMDFEKIGTSLAYRANHWFKIYLLPTRYFKPSGDISSYPLTYWAEGNGGTAMIKDHGNAGGLKNRRPWKNELLINNADRKHEMPGYPSP